MPVKFLPAKLLPANLLIGLILFTSVPFSHAQDSELPLDLIELLGELDDDDALDAALLEIEIKKNSKVNQPNEVKK